MGAEVSAVSSTVQARNPQNFLFNKTLSGGGFVHWLHIHFIDALLYLTGQEIVSVQAMAANAGGELVDVEDVAAAALEFQGGAVGMVFGGYLLPRWVTESHVKLHGSELSLEIGREGLCVLNAERDRHPSDLPVPDPQASTVSARYAGYGGATGVAMIRDWLQATHDQSYRLSSTGDDLVRVLAVIDAIYASAQSGRRTSVERYA
jgi:predicted dehydrogenase